MSDAWKWEHDSMSGTISVSQAHVLQEALCDFLGIDVQQVAGRVTWNANSNDAGDGEVDMHFKVPAEAWAEICDRAGIPESANP